MGISIIVDASRSRILYRAAKKYHSQALEADGLHFSTDIWSSTVVILGLTGVKLREFFPKFEFLHHADAVAAIAVALIVVFVSFIYYNVSYSTFSGASRPAMITVPKDQRSEETQTTGLGEKANVPTVAGAMANVTNATNTTNSTNVTIP